MGLRLLEYPQPNSNNVIPLHRKEDRACATGAGTVPEPAQLYHLTVLAFLVHIPSQQSGVCASCDVNWPCTQVRLAFRLREGF